MKRGQKARTVHTPVMRLKPTPSRSLRSKHFKFTQRYASSLTVTVLTLTVGPVEVMIDLADLQLIMSVALALGLIKITAPCPVNSLMSVMRVTFLVYLWMNVQVQVRNQVDVD